MDKKRWDWLIESRLKSPHIEHNEPAPSPPSPPSSTPPPSPPRTSTSSPPHRNQRNSRRQNTPPPNPPPSPPQNNTSRDYDPDGIGHNLCDSLDILGFSLEDNVTERHIRRRYMQMARKYHPDKNIPEETGRNQEEATRYFQLLNNAQAYLRDRLQ